MVDTIIKMVDTIIKMVNAIIKTVDTIIKMFEILDTIYFIKIIGNLNMVKNMNLWCGNINYWQPNKIKDQNKVGFHNSHNNKVLRQEYGTETSSSVADLSQFDVDPDPGIHIYPSFLLYIVLVWFGATRSQINAFLSGSGSGTDIEVDPDPAKCSWSGWILIWIRNAASYPLTLELWQTDQPTNRRITFHREVTLPIRQLFPTWNNNRVCILLVLAEASHTVKCLTVQIKHVKYALNQLIFFIIESSEIKYKIDWIITNNLLFFCQANRRLSKPIRILPMSAYDLVSELFTIAA